LTIAAIDGLFSSCLSAFFYGSTAARLWQGVASVPLGPTALQGGSRAVLIGLGLHLTVALTWSAVFLLLYESIGALRAITSSIGGVIAVACVYGPLIWMTMSFVVVQHFTHRPPTVTFRWWVQFFGHIPFVALPIVASIASGKPAVSRRSSLASSPA
jgi:hypothetical protein